MFTRHMQRLEAAAVTV